MVQFYLCYALCNLSRINLLRVRLKDEIGRQTDMYCNALQKLDGAYNNQVTLICRSYTGIGIKCNK